MSFKSILKPYKAVFVVCDRNVLDYARQLGDYPIFPIEASENTKTMDSVLAICRWLLGQNADREALLVAVGGGVTTDMVGFAASIYKRGIRYANIPTTLLSQVDAAIGGKTGVNLDSYKNILGVIRQPEFTCILPETLQTLPEREFKSGAAEVLKTFIIKNKHNNYERAVAVFKAYNEYGRRMFENPDFFAELSELIQEAANVKQEIVGKDEFEKGVRRKLNLGHTWGHAIEWYQHTHPCSDPYTHGEAVAIGIIQAAKMAERLQGTKLSEKLVADFKACGLPTELPCPPEELQTAMHKDKKASGGKIRYVLPLSIGKVVVKLL